MSGLKRCNPRAAKSRAAEDPEFAETDLPPVYKTKTIKRLDDSACVFICTTKGNSGGRFNLNMVVLELDGELTLVNPIRLSEDGEEKLKEMGKISQLVRLGPTMHWAHADDYYLKTFPDIKRWAPGDLPSSMTIPIHHELTEGEPKPLPDLEVFRFIETLNPEAALILSRARGGNVLVVGDCIQHQTDNEFINEKVRDKMIMAGLVDSDVVISQPWLRSQSNTSSISAKSMHDSFNKSRMEKLSFKGSKAHKLRNDFQRLLSHEFTRLVSTAGNTVRKNAKEDIYKAVNNAFTLGN